MKKKVIAVIILLLVIGVAAAAIVFMDKQPNKNKEVAEQPKLQVSAKLPEVKVYSGEESIGSLPGYLSVMDTAVLRENLVVVTSESRKFNVEVNSKEAKINSATYEIRTNDGERLIDGGEVTEITAGTKNSTFDIPVSAILETNKEYSFVLIMNTDELGEVYYYSRVMVVEDDFLSAQLNFAREFSDSTMDEEKASGLVIYMEPDATLLNNNLGLVTLSNNYDLITWGNLVPEKITDTEVELKEVYVKETGVSGTYQMKYQIETEGSNEIVENYDVVETITVWTYAEKQYVLDYERTMNQVWEPNDNTIRNSFIDLGIQTDTIVDFIESKEGKYISYIVNGQLWIADISNKKLTKIYETEEKNEEATRILLSTVSDEGNVDFIVYGYQSGAVHRGMNGISVCRYTQKDNTINEMTFIKSDKPASVLAEQIGELCYMNDSVLYLMVNDIVYYVNLVTKETGKLTENLQKGNYAINGDKNIIAYNTGGDLYNSDSITISNLTDNTNQIIEAGAGNKIKVCGYSGNHLVYGIAPESQVDVKKGRMNMSAIKILNEKLEEITTYEKEKIYITEVEITDSVINLKRIKKGQEIEADQLIDNTEKQGESSSSSYYDDTKKYRELALSLATKIGKMEEVKITSPAVFATTTDQIEVIESNPEQEVYYIYASGVLKAVADNKQVAEQIAKENNGLVVNNAGEKIWTFEANYE